MRPSKYLRGMLSISVILGLVVAGFLPVMVSGRENAGVATPGSGEMHWEPCADVADAKCAWIDVPIDPAQPDQAQLSLRLARLPALDPDQSRGSVLIIPGGPGVGITASGGTFGVLRPLFHLDELRQTFDVVTYDPRGIGESSPIRCAPELMPDPVTQSDDETGVLTAEGFAILAQANAVFAEGCFGASGELMEHLSSLENAADIEHIRQALGQDDGLVAYSGSYGTLYAQAYLEAYGDHVKALVLDGVVDHSVDLGTYGARWALSTEDGFDRFAKWCVADATCALHGQDVAATFDEVVAAHPEMRAVVRGRLSAGQLPELGWPVIADLLATAAQGAPASATGEAEPSPTPVDSELEAGATGLVRGVICADYGAPDDFAALAAENALVARQAPHFAWLYSQELPGGCVGWPRQATNPPHMLAVGPHPNVLIANGTHDPATPLVAAISVWSQIPRARLLIADVDGHQVLPVSRCAFEAQVRFLIDPATAPTTTFCPGDSDSSSLDLSRVTQITSDCTFLIDGNDDPRERLGDIACGQVNVPENWNAPGAAGLTSATWSSRALPPS